MRPPNRAFSNYLRQFFIYIRINDWLHTLGLAVLGITFYSYSSLFTPQALLALIAALLYLAHGFSLNNYFDITIDQYINKKFLPPDRMANKGFLALSYSLFLINCFIAYAISIKVLYLVVLGSILTLIYSAPPWRLKKSTFLNILLNSAGFAVIFLIGFTSVSKVTTLAALLMSVLFALVFIPLQIVHQISHSEADKIENILSIYNRYGPGPAIYLSIISLIVLILWSLLVGLLYRSYLSIFYLTSLFCFFFFYVLWRIKNSRQSYPEAATELRILLRKICVLYGLIMILIFYFTK